MMGKHQKREQVLQYNTDKATKYIQWVALFFMDNIRGFIS